MLHTTITTENNITTMRYHETKVAEWDRNTNVITLDTGGWETPTTKSRMNHFAETLGLGFKVFQKDFTWFVKYFGGDGRITKKFTNNVVVFPFPTN